METGMNAWIANADSGARISLPGGWHWDVSSDKTGCLKDPEGRLCVNYDISPGTNAIRFGKDGLTVAPGLNLWVVQEMGEKFARENFMDDDTCTAYDEFAKERSEKRKEYDKGVRNQLAGLIQLELKEGRWTAHVDTISVKDITGIDSKSVLTLSEGVALFNRMSEARHVMPLRDPLGYMTLKDNLYDHIKEQYASQYEDMIDNIDAGFINGNGRGCEAILNKLDATVRKNIREYCLPDGVNYQHLRNIAPTDELMGAVNEFVKQRVVKTVNFEKKRDHSKDALEKDHEKFLAAGENLKARIADAALPPMDMSFAEDSGIEIG